MTVRGYRHLTAFATGLLVVPRICYGAPFADSSGAAGDPWAVGYAIQVARSCPGWKVESQETLADRGVLVRPKPGAGLLPLDGSFQRDYYRGQAAAEKDLARRKDFCSQVVAVAAAKWPRLKRILTPTGRR